MTRAERVVQIRPLRGEGLSVSEICERVGLARSTVYELLRDPTGEKVRARKACAAGTCEDCGSKTSGLAGGRNKVPRRCRSCATRHDAAAKQEISARHIKALEAAWATGETMCALAARLGYANANSLKATIVKLRREGHDFPYRYRVSDSGRRRMQRGGRNAAKRLHGVAA